MVYFQLLRPKQWIKNLFVIAPVVFSFSFLDPTKVGQALLAFVLFSLVTSGIYVVNDIFDLSYDRKHPLKKSRPLARGAVSVSHAWLLATALLGVGFIASYSFSPLFFSAVLVYGILNVFYTVWLKHVALLDMFSVALSLVLRVVAGIFAIGVALSPWILGATFFIALFLIATKRKRELVIAAEGERRPVARVYTSEFLDEVIFASLILTLAIYILYAFLEVRSFLFLVTLLPVTYGLFRFRWLGRSGIDTDNPTDMVFRDPPLQLAVIIFGILVVSIFTLPQTEYAALFFAFP